MKILITGGCGFIGSNFIRCILNSHPGYKIVNLDKLTYSANLTNLKDIDGCKNYKFIRGDICNPKTVSVAMKGCDSVINFAAESHVDRSIKDCAEFIRTNVDGVRVLLEAARKFKVKRFLQISTDEAYGDIKSGFSREADALLPNSPYAASKAAADLLCRSYFHTHKLPILITRSSNNFGPYQYPEKVIPLFITNAIEDKPLPLYGDGKNVRDWIYVLDNCSAIDLVLHKGKIGEIYNVGGGNQIKNIDMAKEIAAILCKGYKILKFVADRPGHDRRYALDSAKIMGLGWRPQYDFKEALKLTIEWYIANEKWWRPLREKADIIRW